jgi:hypothetical protein
MCMCVRACVRARVCVCGINFNGYIYKGSEYILEILPFPQPHVRSVLHSTVCALLQASAKRKLWFNSVGPAVTSFQFLAHSLCTLYSSQTEYLHVEIKLCCSYSSGHAV